MSGQNDDVRNEAGNCGPGCACNCGSPTGLSKRAKWLICGSVMLAACGVVAARVAGDKEGAPKAEQGFALPAAAAPAVEAAAAPDAVGWDAPLKGLAELNLVATNTEAVFVVIPADDAARTAAIKKEVAAASATISGRGTKIGKYLLSKDAEDYKGVVAQLGAPSVLAMVKRRGMDVVADKDVSKDTLLKAFVTASRPRTGCGAGGCGPSGCK